MRKYNNVNDNSNNNGNDKKNNTPEMTSILPSEVKGNSFKYGSTHQRQSLELCVTKFIQSKLR